MEKKSSSQLAHTFLEWPPAPLGVTIIQSECRPALSNRRQPAPGADLVSITLNCLCHDHVMCFLFTMIKWTPFSWSLSIFEVTGRKFSKDVFQSSFKFYKLSDFHPLVAELFSHFGQSPWASFSHTWEKEHLQSTSKTESKISFLSNTQRHSYRLEAPVPSRMGARRQLAFPQIPYDSQRDLGPGEKWRPLGASKRRPDT